MPAAIQRNYTMNFRLLQRIQHRIFLLFAPTYFPHRSTVMDVVY